MGGRLLSKLQIGDGPRGARRCLLRHVRRAASALYRKFLRPYEQGRWMQQRRAPSEIRAPQRGTSPSQPTALSSGRGGTIGSTWVAVYRETVTQQEGDSTVYFEMVVSTAWRTRSRSPGGEDRTGHPAPQGGFGAGKRGSPSTRPAARSCSTSEGDTLSSRPAARQRAAAGAGEAGGVRPGRGDPAPAAAGWAAGVGEAPGSGERPGVTRTGRARTPRGPSRRALARR